MTTSPAEQAASAEGAAVEPGRIVAKPRSIPVEIKTKTTILLDLETAAKWFCGLSDDEQCRFFVEVAKEAETFGGIGSQFYFVGSHLRNCTCSTDEAREIIREMHRGLETGNH